MNTGLFKKILLAGGTVSIAVGTYLPWLRSNWNVPPDANIPAVYAMELNAGLEGFSIALLGVVGLVLLVRAISSRTDIGTAITLAVGLGTMVYPVYYLSTFTLAGFSARYVPTLEWYLTILGGILFAIVGGIELSSKIRLPMVTASRSE